MCPYGYITDDMIDCHIEPESIRISGDPEVVSTTNQINLGSVSIRQLLEDNVTELTLPIILPNGVTTDSEYSYATITHQFQQPAADGCQHDKRAVCRHLALHVCGDRP